jgi:YhcN/YlaJ family sporulation lipoprotein
MHNKFNEKGGILMLRNNIKMFVLLFMMFILAVGCAAKRDGTVNQQQMRTQDQTITKDRVQIATQASEKIAQLNGVTSANVLVTGKNAYVAVVLNPNQPLSRDFEDQIAQQVKSTDPAIQNVYVSANPDFVSRVQTYVNDVRLGKPVSGFFNEFTEIVRRLFPTAH